LSGKKGGGGGKSSWIEETEGWDLTGVKFSNGRTEWSKKIGGRRGQRFKKGENKGKKDHIGKKMADTVTKS